MPWAKLDDRFHSHPKVREAWYRCPASIGLHVMCITYAADHQTDGVIPSWFVAAFFQRPKEMQEAVSTLIELGMWEERASEFVIHDFLEFHTSKADRAAEAKRKQEERERRKLEAEEAAREGVSG